MRIERKFHDFELRIIDIHIYRERIGISTEREILPMLNQITCVIETPFLFKKFNLKIFSQTINFAQTHVITYIVKTLKLVLCNFRCFVLYEHGHARLRND